MVHIKLLPQTGMDRNPDLLASPILATNVVAVINVSS